MEVAIIVRYSKLRGERIAWSIFIDNGTQKGITRDGYVTCSVDIKERHGLDERLRDVLCNNMLKHISLVGKDVVIYGHNFLTDADILMIKEKRNAASVTFKSLSEFNGIKKNKVLNKARRTARKAGKNK